MCKRISCCTISTEQQGTIALTNGFDTGNYILHVVIGGTENDKTNAHACFFRTHGFCYFHSLAYSTLAHPTKRFIASFFFPFRGLGYRGGPVIGPRMHREIYVLYVVKLCFIMHSSPVLKEKELVSECQLPECQLQKCQLPKCQLPKMSTPKISTFIQFITDSSIGTHIGNVLLLLIRISKTKVQ